MSWGEIIQAAFGEPREGEPASLRRDIADELADHLASAERDEWRKTNDEEEAKANALERFGNPKKVARDLWWLNMKETVMKDRVLLAAMVVMAAMCVVVGGMAYAILQQNRTANEAILAKIEQLNAAPPGTVVSRHGVS